MSRQGGVRTMLALALVAGGCAADVAGSGPGNLDVAPSEDFNFVQNAWSTSSSALWARSTDHSECADGRCVDLLFENSTTGVDAFACARTVQASDFTLTFTATSSGRRIIGRGTIPGAEAWDQVLFASSTDQHPSGPDFGTGGAFEGCLGPDGSAPDVVTLHLSATAWDRMWGGLHDSGDQQGHVTVVLSIPGRPNAPAQGQFDLVRTTFVLVPDPQCPQGNTCVHVELRSSLSAVTSGFARMYTLYDGVAGPLSDARGPFNGLDVRADWGPVPGQCPSEVCGTAGRTIYFPPHNAAMGRFVPDRERSRRPSPSLEPAVLGVFANVDGQTYVDIRDMESRSAPITVLDGADRVFNPSAACALPAPFSCAYTIEQRGHTHAQGWDTGVHIDTLDITTDYTPLFVGDPIRLRMQRVTQTASGAHLQGAGFMRENLTSSLFRFDSGSVETAYGTTVHLAGNVHLIGGAPVVSAVRILFGDAVPVTFEDPGTVVAVDAAGHFDLAVTFEGTRQWNTYAIVASAPGSQVYGYDVMSVHVAGDTAVTTVPPFPNPNRDNDGDGLTDNEEIAQGLSPVLADSDNDGIVDGVEAGGTFSWSSFTIDPLNPDTDGDGILDGAEGGPTADDDHDGIPNWFDANPQIGPQFDDTFFLVEERWHSDVQATLDDFDEIESVDLDAEVEFTLTYAVSLVELTNNGVSADAAFPLPDEENPRTPHLGLTAMRAYPLDHLGIALIRDIDVHSTECTLNGPEGSVQRACDLVPTQVADPNAGGGTETWDYVLPNDERYAPAVTNFEINATAEPAPDAHFLWHVFPPAGAENDRPTASTEMPLGGFEQVDFQRTGFVAHWGGSVAPPFGTGPAGALTFVSMARAHVAGTDSALRGGPTFALLLRGTADGFRVIDPGMLPTDAVPQSLAFTTENNNWQIAPPTPVTLLDLWSFTTMTARVATPEGLRTAVVPSYTLAVEDVARLARGETIEVTSEASTGLAGAGSQLAFNPTGENLFAQTSPRTGHSVVTRLHRRIDATIIPIGLEYVEGSSRVDYETRPAASTAGIIEGTDTAWDGRAGFRAHQGASHSVDSATATSGDWFRVQVALHAAATGSRSRRMVDRVLGRCRTLRTGTSDELGTDAAHTTPSERRDACVVHARVQVESPRHASPATSCGNGTVFGPSLECTRQLRLARGAASEIPEGVVLSQDVPLEVLDRPGGTLDVAGRRGGLVLRWTGQPETPNTLNAVTINSDGTASPLARIAGCVAFPDETSYGALFVSGTGPRFPAPQGMIVQPGSYDMRATLFPSSARGGPMNVTTVGCSPQAAAVSDSATDHGRRRRVDVGFPVAILDPIATTLEQAIQARYTTYSVADASAAATAYRAELTSFWSDLAIGVDAYTVMADLPATPPIRRTTVQALPPYGTLALAMSAPARTACGMQYGLGAPEAAGQAFLSRPIPAQAMGCVYDGALAHFSTFLGDRLDLPGCDSGRYWAESHDPGEFYDSGGPVGPDHHPPLCPSVGPTGACVVNRTALPGFLALSPAQAGRTMAFGALHELGHLLGLDHTANSTSQAVDFCAAGTYMGTTAICGVHDEISCRSGGGLSTSILGLSTTPTASACDASPVLHIMTGFPWRDATCALHSGTTPAGNYLYRMPEPPPPEYREYSLCDVPGRQTRIGFTAGGTCTGSASSLAFLRAQFGVRPH